LYWSVAGAQQAIEFYPSPVFAGRLQQWLSLCTSGLQPLEIALLNLGVTLGCAVLAHAATTTRTASIFQEYVTAHFTDSAASWITLEPFEKTGKIVCEALGFGLGIAWNVLLMQWIEPDVSSSSSQDLFHVLVYWFVFTGYLLFVCVLALRLATFAEDLDHSGGDDSSASTGTGTVWDRQRTLLSFAANVVCAFTLVAYGNALFQPNWMGNLQCLFMLLLLSALSSALVAQSMERVIPHNGAPDSSSSSTIPSSSMLDQVRPVCDTVTVIPCTWICCPWLPLLWILSNDRILSHRERWYHVISLVTGLACSIEASGMLTAATDGIAVAIDLCTEKQCRSPWMFVGLQIAVAVITTIVILYLMAYLPGHERSLSVAETGNGRGGGTTEGCSGTSNRERLPLLHKFRRSETR
jgi:hypothetical protein